MTTIFQRLFNFHSSKTAFSQPLIRKAIGTNLKPLSQTSTHDAPLRFGQCFQPSGLNLNISPQKKTLHSQLSILNSKFILLPSKFISLTSAFLILTSLLVNKGWGQVSAYTFSQSAGTYSEFSDGTLTANNTNSTNIIDDNVYDGTIGFTFRFNGVDYTTFKISANGFITFGATSPTGSTPISGSTAYAGAISGFGLDLLSEFWFDGTNGPSSSSVTSASSTQALTAGQTIIEVKFASGTTISSISGTTLTMSNSSSNTASGTRTFETYTGSIRVKTTGSAGSRTCAIQFRRFSPWASLATVAEEKNITLSFQIILYETSNKIDIVYGNCSNSNANTHSPQVGLRGSSNSDYNNRTKSANNAWINNTSSGGSNSATINYNSSSVPASGTTFTWTPPAACTNPTTAGSIGSAQTICYNGDPANLTSSGLPTGHSGTLEYKWQSSTTSSSSGFADIASTNSTAYDPPTGLTQTTWYRRLARVSCAADWSGAIATAAVQVTVRSQFTAGQINSTGETICYNGNSANITSTTAASGGDASITYKWQANGVDIASSNSAAYDPSTSLTSNTTYTRWAKDGTCNSFTQSTGSWVVTVRSQFTAGQINSTGETICYNGNSANITSTTAASGGDASITYKWQANGVDIASSNSAAYDPSTSLTSNTTYTRWAQDGTCNSFTQSTGSWVVTVSSQSVGGSVSGGTSVCSGTNSTNLTLSGHTGSVTKWQYSTVNDFSSDVTDVTNTSTSLTATNLSTTRYYRVVVTSGACAAAYSSSATITVNPSPTTQASNLVASNLGTTTLTLSWTRGNGSGVAVFVKANPNVASDPTNGTSYTANTAFGSGSQIGSSGWYCVYSGTGTTVNITGLSSGTTYNFSAYEYSSSTCYHLTEATASASTYCTLNNNNQTTYKITSFSTSGGCSSMSNTSTRNVPSGCLIDYTASYSTSHDRSSTVSFSMASSHNSYYAIWIDWNIDGDFADAGENVYLNNNGNSSVSSSFSVPAGATLGTTRMRVGIDYMYTLSSSMQCGSNDSYSQYEDYSFVVNAVGTTPTAPSVGTITQPTCTTSSGSVELSGLPSSGSWTVTGSPSGSLSSSGTTVTVTGLSAGQTYTFTVTNSSNCTSTSSGNAVINTQPSTPSAPTSVTPSATTICHGNSVNLNATSAGNTINWYTVATDGTAIQTGVTSAANHSVSPTANTTYYAEAQNGSGCKSSRVATGLVTVENPVSAVNTAIGTTLQTNDYVWVGQTNSTWSTANNWRQFNGTNLVAAGSAPASDNTNRIYVVQNSTSSNCIFNATSLSLGAALGVTSLFVGTGTSLNLNNQNLDLSGNITINGTFTPGSGTITLSGNTNQTLDGSSALSFSNLTINKSGGTLTASKDMTITGTLDLTSGILDMNSKALTMGTSSANGTITGGSASSYIVALDATTPSKLIHWVNSTSNATYSFPIGTGSKYTPVTVVMKGGTLSNASIQVWTKNSKVTGMSNAMSCHLNRAWFVEPTGITSPTYDIQLGFASGDFTGDAGFDLNPVKLSSGVWYKPSGSLLQNGTTQGTTIATTYASPSTPTSSSGTVYWNGLTSFSEFGGGGGSAPLPVELVSFSGSCEDGSVHLSWQTASEFNSSHFDVEKSRDGENWQVIETISAAGNSHELLNYETFDQVSNALNYYRLNQVDIDGTNKRYDPIVVSCEASSNGIFITYPNPSNEGFNVLINDNELEGEMNMNIYTATGSVAHQKRIVVKEGINVFMMNEKLLPGVYFIEVKDQQNKTKVIKHLVN